MGLSTCRPYRHHCHLQNQGSCARFRKGTDLPPVELTGYVKHADYGSYKNLAHEMEKSPFFRKITAPLWSELD